MHTALMFPHTITPSLCACGCCVCCVLHHTGGYLAGDYIMGYQTVETACPVGATVTASLDRTPVCVSEKERLGESKSGQAEATRGIQTEIQCGGGGGGERRGGGGE